MICKDANPKYIHNVSCSTKPISHSDELINGSGTLHANVTIQSIYVGVLQIHMRHVCKCNHALVVAHQNVRQVRHQVPAADV